MRLAVRSHEPVGAAPRFSTAPRSLGGARPWNLWSTGSWRSADVPSLRYPVKLALVVAGYYAAAHLGFAFHFTGPIAAIVWLPVGVGIAALYLLGLSAWPA